MALLYAREGKPAQAARLFGARWARGAYHFLSPAERTQRDEIMAALREDLGEERFERLYEEGKAMSLDEAVACALRENEG